MNSETLRIEQGSFRVFLCDNGSVSPDAIRALRDLANSLAGKLNLSVRAVGLLHSDRVGAGLLDGEAGNVLLSELRQLLEVGERRFALLPFFLGPSFGITDWLPRELRKLVTAWPGMQVKLGACLHREGDDRLALVLAERVRSMIAEENLHRPIVAMVDHGTPSREVNLVRERVGARVRELLGDEVAYLATCSMERRPQPEYDFNEPLLENLLRDPKACPSSQVVVAQFFLSPGRHAGPVGDVAKICRESEHARVGLRTYLTPPMGDHPLVLEILAERFQECLESD